MPEHRERRHLPYTPEQLYALVLDVERYPAFLPWCQATRVYQVHPDHFSADVRIGYKMLRESYSCEVHHQAPQRIAVVYRSGPFSRLGNDWQFTAAPDGGCTVDFHIDFEFRSRLLQKVAGNLFYEVLRRMVSAFEARAHTLYGS